MIKSEFRVDSVDLWKKSSPTEKLVEGYMICNGSQTLAYFFEEKGFMKGYTRLIN
jgi:hypothetical protein